MTLLLVLAVVVIACFGGVLLFGAPYLPTLSRQVEIALDLAGLQPGQTLLELGCGDGRILLAAARRGLRAEGYELNPIMFAIAWLRTRRYRHLIRVHCANFWSVEWPAAPVIFVFLHPRFMKRLDERIVATARPVRLISFAFSIPGRRPNKRQGGVYQYDYR